MSVNFSADLRSRVEPCVLVEPLTALNVVVPSAALCTGFAMSISCPLKVGHLVKGSVGIGKLANRFRRRSALPPRWQAQEAPEEDSALVQIER